MNNEKVTENIFSLIFYQSEHGGKIRLTSRHPETREYIFPHRDWENLSGGSKVRAGLPCHCTLEPAQNSKCWIAIPCVGMSLTAEVKSLEIKAAQLTEREQNLQYEVQRLAALSERLNDWKTGLETAGDDLALEREKLNAEKRHFQQALAAMQPFRNALRSATEKIEAAKIDLIDLIERVEQLNKKVPLNDRLVTSNLLDAINKNIILPELQDYITAPRTQRHFPPQGGRVIFPFRRQAGIR